MAKKTTSEEQDLLEAWSDALGLMTSAVNAQKAITNSLLVHVDSIMTITGPEDCENSLSATYANLLLNTRLRLDESEIHQNEFSRYLHQKDGLDFFRHLRVTHESYAFLLNKVQEKYTPVYTGGNHPIDANVALDILLWYLGHNSSYHEISKTFGLSMAYIFTSVRKILNIFCDMLPEIIKWPSKEELKKTEKRFSLIADFPGVVGVIDGYRICVKMPRELTDYISKEANRTVILIAVCDDKKKFTYISTGFPGSMQKSEAFEKTDLYNTLKENPHLCLPGKEYHMIGSSVFVPSQYLLVPYVATETLSQKQEIFNSKLLATRNVIRNAFDLLRARFSRLEYIDADLKNISEIITACCVLHNITMDYPGQETLLQIESSFNLHYDTEDDEELSLDLSYDLELLDKMESIAGKL